MASADMLMQRSMPARGFRHASIALLLRRCAMLICRRLSLQLDATAFEDTEAACGRSQQLLTSLIAVTRLPDALFFRGRQHAMPPAAFLRSPPHLLIFSA